MHTYLLQFGFGLRCGLGLGLGLPCQDGGFGVGYIVPGRWAGVLVLGVGGKGVGAGSVGVVFWAPPFNLDLKEIIRVAA